MSPDHYQRRRSSGASSLAMPHTPKLRDSHDLSLSPRDVTRDSLVTNMLLSLDQFSLNQQQQQQQQQQQPHTQPANRHHHDTPRIPPASQRHPPFDGAPPWLTSSPHANPYQHHHSTTPSRNLHTSYSSDLDASNSSSHSPTRQNSPPNIAVHANQTTVSTRLRLESSDSSSVELAATDENLKAAPSNIDSTSPDFSFTQDKQHQQERRQPRSPGTSPGRGPSPSQRPSSVPSRQRRAAASANPQIADNTADYSQLLVDSASSPQHDHRDRSASRNKSSGSRKQRRAAAQRGQAHPPIPSSSTIDYDVDYLNQDYAAAPTPNVPIGPRRGPAGLPPPPPDPASSLTLELRRTSSQTLSHKSSSGKIKNNTASHKQQQKKQPPIPMDDYEAAPSPNVGYGKAKEGQRAVTSHGAAPGSNQRRNLQQNQFSTRERPGFFRRVFGGGGGGSGGGVGSSKNSLASNEQPQQHSNLGPLSPSRSERPLSSKPAREHSKSLSLPSSRETASPQSQQHPPLPPLPPLQKKSSSFFRRLKKLTSDEAPPLRSVATPTPNVPLSGLNTDTLYRSGGTSPVSSLRQALDPFLRNSAGSAKALAVDKSIALADITNLMSDGEDQSSKDGRDNDGRKPESRRLFSPDYEPGPNAKIRTVPTDADQGNDVVATTSPVAAKNVLAKQSFLDLDGASDDEPTSSRGDVTSKSDAYSESGSVSQKDTSKDDTIRASKMPFPCADKPSSGTSRNKPELRLPSDGKGPRSVGSVSTETDYKSAPSAPPSVRVEDLDEASSPKSVDIPNAIPAKKLDKSPFGAGEPTKEDMLKAKKIYDGLEDFVSKDKAAAWMGEDGPARKRTLQAYIELYNFTDQSILSALRSICGRLILRAETQQVDRILVAFSQRWCDCNPNHGFKATDVVHTICYSIMLLNTDLHLADIEQKMTRSQFVKNTLSTIRQTLLESNPQSFQRPSILPDRSPMPHADSQSSDQDRSSFRHSFRPSPRPDTQGAADNGEDSGPLVRTAFTGPLRAWEEQIEQVLKSIYSSIRDDRLPLFGSEDRNLSTPQTQSNLSVVGMLKRTPSVLSKAPSEGQMSSRGRIADGGRSSTSRWTSKSRSRPGMGRNGMVSSRTSFDDDSSLWSPALSSATWSRYSLGRTHGSMSQDSFASSMPRGDYHQSIGFANALNQSIIRDEDSSRSERAASIISSDVTPAQLLEDESLELAGPPWVKEGMVSHKHHHDGLGKRAKDRNWSDVFAVVQKGQLSLFSFSMNKSSRHKARPRTAMAPVVGGGNWQDNAVNVGTFNLRLTLASELPPDSSRTRPHVWALSLPTGAVHFFQVGTPEISREFVNTANYWSARLSTHPMVGGISNVEYGWSDAIVNNALVAAINETATPGQGSTSPRPGQGVGHARKSSAHSARSKSLSLEQGHGGSGSGGGGFMHSGGGRGKLPGDRVHIAPWVPPAPSVRPSQCTESEQLETLATYVESIEKDLETHNQLRSPMLLAFTPRGQNAAKAMANWERKSAYLLQESVKFRCYVDGLRLAEARRREVYKEREEARGVSEKTAEKDIEEEEGDDTLRPE